jgi:hypothetical protein
MSTLCLYDAHSLFLMIHVDDGTGSGPSGPDANNPDWNAAEQKAKKV